MYSLRGKRGAEHLATLLPISALFLLFLVATVTTLRKSSPKTSELHIQKHMQVAESLCDGTLYPELCVSTLSTIPDLTSKSLPYILSATVNHTIREVRSSESNCSSILNSRTYLDERQRRALDDCIELLDNTVSELLASVADLAASKHYYHDLQTLFSAAITNQYTCLDGFAYSEKKEIRNSIEDRMYEIGHLVSNSLAMLKKLPRAQKRARRAPEVFSEYGGMEGGFPEWVSRKDRRLLQTAANQTKYNAVVAKDGSGHFTTVAAAVEAAPNMSSKRYVIYIKAGAYLENVEVGRKKTMLMFVGDGIEKTVIKASRNVFDGWTTFRSATVAVVGNGFIAKGISIENTAGPSKHQAVALRSGSDLSAFYQCRFVGYQDTLYAHSNRQFYRDCDVYGTVDFVFGNAAVVLQNCNLYARKPNENQKNIFTAQGREDPNQNTGISILNSKVAAAADLIPVQSSFKTYLGRPWKLYSRTVFLRSNIGDLVDPAGWLEWDGKFALSTLYYGEYMNRGAGSKTSARVTWPGFRVINSSTEASKFTVGSFLQGGQWLPPTGIPYYPGLS
ncbi:pectinesterase [Malania oleifera]|uniref:pectinesterase n=1 Tax=Malania oleifera TaxID=397392 RepID=UPI0025AE827A|nr:pectinesterase [Malania oleifera]